MKSVTLKRFDPTTMDVGCSCLIVGKRSTGKSVLAADLLSKWRKTHADVEPIVLNAAEKAIDVSAEIEHVINRPQVEGPTPAYLLLENAGFHTHFFKTGAFDALFLHSRDYQISWMANIQYMPSMTAGQRANTDYVFALRDNIRQNQQKVYEMFGMIPTLREFHALMDSLEEYECLVVDRTKTSSNIEDCVFFYKANCVDSTDG